MNKLYECYHCGFNAGRKSSLLRHIERHNRTNFKRKTFILCNICQKQFIRKIHLQNHLNKEHMPIETSCHKFVSEEDFMKWKVEEEIRSKSFFSKRRTSRQNEKKVVNFVCNRSGGHEDPNPKQRKYITKGYSKSGSYCPAQITAVFYDNGTIEATYCSTHIGHRKELRFLHLPHTEEKKIADKIKSGVPLDTILDEIRSTGLPTTLEKKHLLTRKKLFDIMKKYNIPYERRHCQNDAGSADLVNECSKLKHNPFIVFKKQNETHQILSTSDFMIAFMTEVQIAVLKERGSEKICLDTIHSTNHDDFQLVTVVVVDEFGDGFPAAFCITNRIDEVAMTVFFQQMKNVVGSIKPAVFLSDDTSCFYNVWKMVMGDVDCRILCKWHVDGDWNKKLSLVADKEKKCEIYAYLRLLLEEPDVEQFSTLLIAFIKQLQDLKCDDFLDYFMRTYYERTDLWAACFQTMALRNAIMALEAFHNLLKHKYFKLKNNERIDVLLDDLLKMVRDKSFNRFVYLEEGYANHFMKSVHNRHRLSRRLTNISQVSEKQWKVIVGPKDAFYSVESDIVDSCDCRQKCILCDVCVHMYSCTCVDYLVKHNMCKHIHAVRMLQVADEENMSNDSFPEPVPISNVEIEIDPSLNDDDYKPSNMNYNNSQRSNKDIVGDKLRQVVELWENVDIESTTNEEEQKMIRYLNEMIDILLRENNNGTNKEPVNENKVPPCRSFSRKVKKEENTSYKFMKTQTATQKDILKEVLLDSNFDISNVEINFDHSYY